MTLIDSYSRLCKLFSYIYEEREAANVAKILLEDAFNWNKLGDHYFLNEEEQNRLDNYSKRLLQHEPIQYVLGQADFYGYKFMVNKQVLIPRAETEELVFWIESIFKQLPDNKTYTLLDIGTGSGCIPITLKRRLGDLVEVEAVDISESALQVAKTNALINDVEILLFKMDILNNEAWPKNKTYDFIVSNPPYIPKKEMEFMSESTKLYEPQLALFSPDDDPLIFYKKITKFAKQFLNKNGYIMFELNEFRSKEVAIILANNNFTNIKIEKDMQGKDRMIVGRSEH